MKVFIIGGTKFMGPHVVRFLVERGHEVMIFHRGNSRIDLPSGVQELLGDRKQITDFRAAIEAFNPDLVLDMIALFEQDAEQLEEAFQGIVDRVVLISSADVYRSYEVLTQLTEGPVQSTPIKETDDLRTIRYPYRGKMETDFARDYDKILVEERLLASKEFKTTVLRLPMVYGPKDPNRRFMSFIHRIQDNRPYIILDERHAGARFTKMYAENVALAIVMAIENEETAGHILNVGEEEPVTILEWVKRIKEAMQWSGEIIVVPPGVLVEELGMNTQQELFLDTTKLRKQFGYKELISIEDGLKQTIDWELHNPPEGNFAELFHYNKEDEVFEKL